MSQEVSFGDQRYKKQNIALGSTNSRLIFSIIQAPKCFFGRNYIVKKDRSFNIIYWYLKLILNHP
jgi:hypothetical protein